MRGGGQQWGRGGCGIRGGTGAGVEVFRSGGMR
eukprot:COSAG03_NODE_25530_length_265_cov_0.602410_1_plen_32_part_01